MELLIEDLMRELVERGGSDLHLSSGIAPYGRFNGDLQPMREEKLSQSQCTKLIFSILNTSQRKDLEQTWELDCAYSLKGVSRFRLNVYRQLGSYAACLRALGDQIPTLEMLQMPPVVQEMGSKPRGLVLVTGPTGSGKTTTLASLLNHINNTSSRHIITIEDPIEFVYQSNRSLIHQREVHEDTHSTANALRSALREDPDVILVGEMRDLETIQLAITAAETGHLVFGTLHTNSASQTVDRILDVFPSTQQSQIRAQLSNSLVAVFCQTLLKRCRPGENNYGRIVAQEILIQTPATSNLIREGKTAQLYSQIQTGGQYGMQTLERALAVLVQEGIVELAEALSKSSRPEDLQRLLEST
jgi:twitching motility protein PilT